MINKEIKYSYSLIKKASENLKLSYETQDWGIINADGGRVVEFMNYFNDNPNFEDSLKYEILELIIASFNDAILNKKITKNCKTIFIELLEKTSREKVFETVFNYWKNLESYEYPVSELLQTHIQGNR